MSRLSFALVLGFALYVALILLLYSVLSAGSGIVWCIWAAGGAAALSATAIEWIWLAVWVWMWLTGRRDEDPHVVSALDEDDRAELTSTPPTVAILLPAHNEATTPEDAQSLQQRVKGILQATPLWTTVYLLFDSPADQQSRELALVEQLRQELADEGRPEHACRLCAEQYRDKPPRMRNKPGSIVCWLKSHQSVYRYFFVLDADSSFPDRDSVDWRERDGLERLVLAMQRDPDLAMIQTATLIRQYRTPLGWLQAVGTRMGLRYYGRVLQWLFQHQAPCFGHSVLFRTSDFVAHAVNTLVYLSHDLIDSADLAAAGCKCVYTCSVITYEEAEDSLQGFLVRECRWARGNAQWLNYLWTKPGLPLGPAVYLSLGILFYVLPLCTAVLATTSVFLLCAGVPMIDIAAGGNVRILLGLVLGALFIPKLVAADRLRDASGDFTIGLLLSPALMCLRGFLFLIGAFGTKWSPRRCRSEGLDSEHLLGILRWFYPVSLLGLMLYLLLLPLADMGLGVTLIRLHVGLMILSPVLALAVSWPSPFGFGSEIGIKRVNKMSATSRAAHPGKKRRKGRGTLIFANLR